MKRFLAWILLTGIFPAAVSALGLGKLDLKSGLNEPFEATIELLSPTRDELDNLAVRLADSEAFQRAGIERPFILSQLRFEVEDGGTGPDRVRVYSREAMREPFLNFLVEANWSRGRLFREYTVLLDPPLYDAAGFAAPEPQIPPRAVELREPVESPAEYPVSESTAGTAAPSVAGYSGGDYGPTVTNDTLWSIATRTRPDEGTTVQQMMLALVRANPDAFINNNVNGLKRGQILRMPSQEELVAVAAEDAFAQVKAQYAAWQQAGGIVPAETATRPASTAAVVATDAPSPPAPAAPAAAATEAKPELKLVTPSSQGTGADQGANEGASSSGTGKPDERLALADEQIEALSQENLELKERLTLSATIVEDLNRLIALKDDELAAIQQKLAEREAAQVAAPPAATQPVAAPAETAPAAAEPEPAAEPPAAEPEVEPAPQEEKVAQPPAAEVEQPIAEKAPPKPTPVDTSAGLVSQITGMAAPILGMVKGNIQIVAMVGGGLAVILVLAFLFARRRSRADEEEETSIHFPDVRGSEAETMMSGLDEEEIEVEKVSEPVSAPAKSQPKARVEPAPAAVAVKPAAAVKAAAPVEEAPAAPQEDPLGPVNVFMAYEHFDQAEEFVRDAIGREPENLDFHVKLLEVLSAANERRKYEDAAKVLHDKVNGTGAYWESALFYWDTMSPGRALFAAPAGGEDEAPAAAAAGGGMLDLTAGESAKETSADLGLDFDLGEATAAPTPAPAAAPAEEEGMLDITAGSDGGSPELSMPSSGGEDVLDVTAAVGLDDIEPSAAGTGGHEEEGVLDLSQSGGEDLLDVTSHADMGSSDLKEDLLDVTTATGASADADDLLAAPAEPAGTGDEGSVDFDLNLDGAGAEPSEPPARADNVIEFEGSGTRDRAESLDLDFTTGSAAPEEEDGGLELDLSASGDGELSLDSAPDDGGIELDMNADDSGSLEFELDKGGDAEPAAAKDDVPELDLSIEMPQDEESDIDMEGTVEVKKLGLSLDAGDDEDEDEDEDDEDRTVFVPRTKDAQEQTAEDEIATKLDLAKAYVELGDKPSAKAILNEVISAGNPQQKKQAQELMKQMS